MIRRLLFSVIVCGLALGLAACGAPPPDLSVPDPPGATFYEQTQNEHLDRLIAAFDGGLQDVLVQQGFAVKKRQRLSTAASVGAVEQFYTDELLNRGWEPVPSGLPDGNTRTLLAFQKSNVLLVVAAFDAAPYFGQGVVIYTLQATK